MDYKNVTPYQFCKYKYNPILPLVYDDALSYLETLGQFANKLNEVVERVNDVTTDSIEQAKAYTDSKVAEQTEEVQRAVTEVKNLVNTVEQENANFKRVINAQLDIMNANIEGFRNEIEADIHAVNARTDLAIQQNNEYILSELPKFLSGIKVINYFTGEQVSIQGMFDYLATLHTENSINYDKLAMRDKTYNELASLNMTYTQLVLDGGSIIV